MNKDIKNRCKFCQMNFEYHKKLNKALDNQEIERHMKGEKGLGRCEYPDKWRTKEERERVKNV